MSLLKLIIGPKRIFPYPDEKVKKHKDDSVHEISSWMVKEEPPHSATALRRHHPLTTSNTM